MHSAQILSRSLAPLRGLAGGVLFLLSLTVPAAANTAPEAPDCTFSVADTGVAEIRLPVSDDTTPAGMLDCLIVTPPAAGTLTYRYPDARPHESREVVYTTEPGHTGLFSLLYKAVDTQGLESAVGTITIYVGANHPPTATDESHSFYMNTLSLPTPLAGNDHDRDVEYYCQYGFLAHLTQAQHYEIITPPAHGQLTNFNAQTGEYRYTPDPEFQGADTFTWRLSDPLATTDVATVSISVVDGRDRSGRTVLLIVNSNLLPNISNEVHRLKLDMEAEGYTVKLKPWPSSGTSAHTVWNYLQSEYSSPTQALDGAVLIGQIPKPTTTYYNDLVYWNMQDYQTSGNVGYLDIWVSRMNVDKTTYGSEVTLLKRALDANHNYRAGISRLPHTAYYYNCRQGYFEMYEGGASLLEVWPALRATNEVVGTQHKAEFFPARTDISEAGADAFVGGGDILVEDSHGNANSYMGGAFKTADLFRLIAQQRVGIIESCVVGVPGGIVNHHIYTRGGGLTWAIGASTLANANCYDLAIVPTDYPRVTVHARARAMLAGGESWGRTMATHPWFGARDMTMIYGDLSMRPLMTPEPNTLPVITGFSADKTTVVPGERVTFTVTFADPDAAGSDSPHADYEHRIEWFLDGYDSGRAAPANTTDSREAGYTTVSHSYPSLGTRNARVEVIDEWLARGWKERSINVVEGIAAEAGPALIATDADGSGFEPVGLDGTGSGSSHGAITGYVWTAAGIEIPSGPNPTVDFPVGTHTVTLLVTDTSGRTDTDTVQVTVLADSDTDADGIPDSLDPDDDNDGMLDTDEVIAGTDPLDPGSCLIFSFAAADGSAFVLRWESASNRIYSVHRGTSLIEGFTEVLDNTITATPPENVYADEAPPRGGAFYNITVAEP